MAKILLDYVFPISVIPTTPEASVAFLKQACVVCKPKSGQAGNVGNIYECTTEADVATRTDNTDPIALLNAGMSRVFVLLAVDLDLVAPLAANVGEFYTLLLSSDWVDEDIDVDQATLVKSSLTFTAKLAGSDGDDISVEFLNTGTAGAEAVTVTGKKISVSMQSATSTATQCKTAIDASAAAMALINPVTIASGQGSTAQTAFAETHLAGGSKLEVGAFDGVVGYATSDATVAAAFAATENQVGFFKDDANGNANMMAAFGALLSNLSDWKNQQFITCPEDDGVDTLGVANALFDDKVSFVIHDSEFGNRLALFAVGGEAIVKPYIEKNLQINLQSRFLSWVTANEPSYTFTEASLLQQRLQNDVIIEQFIETGWIEDGVISIRLIQGNFVANSDINIAKPKALWRMFGQMSSTL